MCLIQSMHPQHFCDQLFCLLQLFIDGQTLCLGIVMPFLFLITFLEDSVSILYVPFIPVSLFNKFIMFCESF